MKTKFQTLITYLLLTMGRRKVVYVTDTRSGGRYAAFIIVTNSVVAKVIIIIMEIMIAVVHTPISIPSRI